jgi:hypothetical protein
LLSNIPESSIQRQKKQRLSSPLQDTPAWAKLMTARFDNQLKLLETPLTQMHIQIKTLTNWHTYWCQARYTTYWCLMRIRLGCSICRWSCCICCFTYNQTILSFTFHFFFFLFFLFFSFYFFKINYTQMPRYSPNTSTNWNLRHQAQAYLVSHFMPHKYMLVCSVLSAR